MKKIYFLTIHLSFIVTLTCNSQQVNVNDLQAPSSPAFTILGIQPSEINKPKSYKAVEASLLTAFSNSGSLSIPSNLAIEVTPFWLKSRPEVSFKKLMNPGADILKHSFAISLATTEKKDINISSGSFRQLAYGSRVTLFPGKLKKDVDVLANSIRTPLAPYAMVKGILNTADVDNFNDESDLKTRIDAEFTLLLSDTSTKRFKTEILALKKNVIDKNFMQYDAVDNSQCHILIEKMLEDVDAILEKSNLSKVIKETSNYYYDRIGFRMDVAGGAVLDFPTNDFEFSNLSKYGLWVTPSWGVKNGKRELLGVLRFIGSRIPQTVANNWDIGSRFILNAGRIQVSAEHIQRWQVAILTKETIPGSNPNETITTLVKTQSWDSRTSFNLQFRISDKLVLTYAIGKNFILNTQFNGNLISILGINFGSGGPVVNFGD